MYCSDSPNSYHIIEWDASEGRWTDNRIEDGYSMTYSIGFKFVQDCKIVGNRYANPEKLV